MRCTIPGPRHSPRSVVALLALTISPSTAAAGVLYVDAGAAAGGDGQAWATAYTHLQDALAAADPAGGVTEIRVAGGVYRPDRSEASPSGTGLRSESFPLLDGVAVRGGYAGTGAGDPDTHDVSLYPTILCGDLAGDDEKVGTADNAYHVVRAAGVGPTARLEGCVVRHGHADGAGLDQSGGGMLLESAHPVIRECVFLDNVAGQGGAVFNAAGSSPALVCCTITSNHATATHAGGVYNEAGDPLLANCRLTGNTATLGGGAVFNFNGSETTMVNCLLAGNTAGAGGGAVYNLILARPRLINCTVVDNIAGSTGGGLHSNSSSDPQLVNCIAWGNADASGTGSAAQLSQGSGQTTADYCCIQGGWPTGVGNLAGDPVFADADGPDDDPDTLDDNDYRLAEVSPCIDAGTNPAVTIDTMDLDADGDVAERTPFDLDLDPRFADVLPRNDSGCGAPVIVDLGAFEHTGTSVDPMLAADIDGSGGVNVTDLLRVLADWGACGTGCCAADLDLDGSVQLGDLQMVLVGWE